jgi:aconitate hydratase
VDLVERYTKAQGLYRSDDAPTPAYSDMLRLDLGSVEPSLAGPKRPQDRIPLAEMKSAFQRSLRSPTEQRGFGLNAEELARAASAGEGVVLSHGAVVIAAITSCTNTSNPSVMIGAGLLAKKAVERGLSVPSYVKTSLAPGSTVVTRYLETAGLTPYLDQLGFNLVGYGCTTCIGNSGPLPEEVVQAIGEGDLVAAAVLSGNRNFEGRINPHVRANYLASPPLVVAYALAGSLDVDLATQPLGYDSDGQAVFLSDVWPSQGEIQQTIAMALDAQMFKEQYADIFTGNETWNAIPVPEAAELYNWDAASTYIQEPPFWVDLTSEVPPAEDIHGARVLALLGDSVTTDHISPAGSIAADSPAGRYLQEHGVTRRDFNSYGSRRGNHEVMVRGTFANIRLRNLLLPGTEGGVTMHLPSGEEMSIFDAAMRYQEEGTPLMLLAGRQYGTGSSRDWAAKGVYLQGVKVVIAESYERIHRSNLVGVGVLPLQFQAGDNIESLGLTGHEIFDITDIAGELKPGQLVTVRARRDDGSEMTFLALARLDTPVEVEYYRNGGVLHTILRRMIES